MTSDASDPAVEIASFDALPEPALRVTMLALPVDARARAACVCRSWRAFLADPSLWQVLDLTSAGGVAAERFMNRTEDLVRGAVKRAAHQLRVFSFNNVTELDLENLMKMLIELFASHGAELQYLNTDAPLTVTEELMAMFPALPRLQVLNTNIICLWCECKELLPLLRNDPPYGPLRVSQLQLYSTYGDVSAADVLALAAAVAAHESLEGLDVAEMHFAPGLNALVDAAAERRVLRLNLQSCDVDAESVPALVRLLQRGSLTDLHISFSTGFPLAQEASVPTLCAALRTCRTLKHLTLGLCPSNGASCRTVTDLLDAAAALPALSELDLSFSVFQDTAAAGHALGALLSANLPNLCTLCVYSCGLGDKGMAALLDGLAANTHLRNLSCDGNNLSHAFARDRLQPALVALRLAAL